MRETGPFIPGSVEGKSLRAESLCGRHSSCCRSSDGEVSINRINLILLAIGPLLLIGRLFKGSECDHTEQVYYDAAGDELPGDQSDACFCICKGCGQTFVIPTGFQSDAHFENYLLYGARKTVD